MNKTIITVLSDTPWPVNSGGKIDSFFMLKAMKQINCRVIAVFAYSHKGDLEKFSQQAKEVCDGWFAYPRKKNIVKALDFRFPYYLKSNKPDKKETDDFVKFLEDKQITPDCIVMNTLNGYFIADFTAKRYPQAKFIYRMQNIESDYFRSSLRTTPFYSPRKWLTGFDLLKMKNIELLLLSRFQNVACISKTELSKLKENYNYSGNFHWIPPFFDFSPDKTLEKDEAALLGKLRSEFGDKPILFCASSFYGRYNVKAVRLFIRNVLPIVQKHHPVYFLIGGFKAGSYFRNDSNKNIYVFSNFSSVKPFMILSDIVLVLSSGKAGVKLKLMEALSYGKRIVSTEAGVSGSGFEDLILNSNQPRVMADYILQQLSTDEYPKEKINLYFNQNFNPVNNVKKMLLTNNRDL